jgi:tetratricopeptide (TPR) repeat protein
VQTDNEKSSAAELARAENSQSTTPTTQAAVKLATEANADSTPAEQARTHPDIEEQVRAALVDSRYEEARALIEQALKTIPLDWKPIQEREDFVFGAFWDQEEFVSYKNSHPALAKPVIWVTPSASKLWWLMSAIDAREGRHDLALTCLLNAWEYEQDHPRIWMARGSALNWMDHFAEALDAYQTAATIRSWTPAHLISDCWHGQGVALGGLHRLPEARDAFARALEIDPGNETARFDLACVLHDLRIMNQRASGQSSPTRVM